MGTRKSTGMQRVGYSKGKAKSNGLELNMPVHDSGSRLMVGNCVINDVYSKDNGAVKQDFELQNKDNDTLILNLSLNQHNGLGSREENSFGLRLTKELAEAQLVSNSDRWPIDKKKISSDVNASIAESRAMFGNYPSFDILYLLPKESSQGVVPNSGENVFHSLGNRFGNLELLALENLPERSNVLLALANESAIGTKGVGERDYLVNEVNWIRDIGALLPSLPVQNRNREKKALAIELVSRSASAMTRRRRSRRRRVCYLNSYEVDFSGGLFHFQDGEPTTIVPMAGDVVMYTADSKNIHSVDEITDGERITLTLWFSRDGSHDEDAKLISFLSQKPLSSLNTKFEAYLPMTGSNNMYRFPPDKASNLQSEFDIRFARIHFLGFNLYSSQDKSFSAVDSSCNFSELLIKPLQLARGDELFEKEFVNILHALQVLHFYFWKGSELQTTEVKDQTNNVVLVTHSQREKIHDLKLVFLKDHQVAETFFGDVSRGKSMQHSFDWVSFSAAVIAWEAYTCKLVKELLMSLPYWKTNQAIFSDPSGGPVEHNICGS
ncbi:unnamed protein product [Ilex paraguariensis]|uniref:Prolyl 4-hydroxylase alpha subunit Fe(2+) 2OG dioxygenase domain-containing protein n=1 Tax=Ilex paraguariensis TaxID=185542 RepID=A0ABC8U567_9AQUA